MWQLGKSGAREYALEGLSRIKGFTMRSCGWTTKPFSIWARNAAKQMVPRRKVSLHATLGLALYPCR
jgi:hypothetical protein